MATDLSAEDREVARDLYCADPSFSSAGGIVTVSPAPVLLGRIPFKLYTKDSPKACENFKALCTGERSAPNNAKYKLHYKDCPIHRVEPGFVIQGGDITRR